MKDFKLKFFIFVILLISTCFSFNILSYRDIKNNYAYAEDKQEDVAKEDDENELEKDKSDLNITTKVYKSTDESADILENEFDNYSLIQENIITKDELLGKTKKKKNINIKHQKQYQKPISAKQILMPWFVLILVGGLMAIIFKVLKIKKLWIGELEDWI